VQSAEAASISVTILLVAPEPLRKNASANANGAISGDLRESEAPLVRIFA